MATTNVEFKISTGQSVIIIPFNIHGTVVGLSITQGGLKQALIRYCDTTGRPHEAWEREDDLEEVLPLAPST